MVVWVLLEEYTNVRDSHRQVLQGHLHSLLSIISYIGFFKYNKKEEIWTMSLLVANTFIIPIELCLLWL